MNTTLTATESRPSRRRALLPLATLLAAAAIAMASGANFTSQSMNVDNAYETGTLTQDNSLAGRAIFDLGNLKPGDSVTGRVTITNDGTLPATFTLTEAQIANNFAQPAKLTLTVTEADGTPVASGRLGAIGKVALGDFGVDEARTYVFTAALDITADDDNQGKSATTTYTWDGVQVDEGVAYDMGTLSQG